MFIPPPFRVPDAGIVRMLQDAPLAYLVKPAERGMHVTPLPVRYDLERNSLTGHVSRANPHRREGAADAESLVILPGVDGYVSPSCTPPRRKRGRWCRRGTAKWSSLTGCWLSTTIRSGSAGSSANSPTIMKSANNTRGQWRVPRNRLWTDSYGQLSVSSWSSRAGRARRRCHRTSLRRTGAVSSPDSPPLPMEPIRNSSAGSSPIARTYLDVTQEVQLSVRKTMVQAPENPSKQAEGSR